MSDDLDEGLSWTMFDHPRVTSRSPFSLLECLSLSIRFWPDVTVGATNEIKTLALFPSLSGGEYMSGSEPPVSVKIYVEKRVQLMSNFFRECDQITTIGSGTDK